MSTREDLARKLASDIESGPQAVQFTGLELLPLLLPFITKLFQCGKDNDDVTPETASARIRTLHDRNPKRLRKRLAANAMRSNHGTVNRTQAFAMADATISRALNTDPAVMSAACSEAFAEGADIDASDDIA